MQVVCFAKFHQVALSCRPNHILPVIIKIKQKVTLPLYSPTVPYIPLTLATGAQRELANHLQRLIFKKE
jgi:hypothetical protein